jgi:Alpha 1,4-glycosyltransferase conserved region
MPALVLPKLHSLWVGNKLNYLERLCIASAKATGHEFTLWSYDPTNLEGVPEGIELRDAAEVMPEEKLLRYRNSDAVALGANFWRIELLAKGLGCWVDMDMIFLKPFDFGSDYIFGREQGSSINNAVVFAPPESKLVADLQSLPRANKCPPWWGPKNRLKFYVRRFREDTIELEDFPWGTFGPGMLTYAIKQNNLSSEAQPQEVFYPVRYRDARDLYKPAEIVEAMVTEKTRAVHMWHSSLKGLSDKPPPPGSFIEKMCLRFGVDPI